jgi:ABC-type glycerol-3-phosphate transport system substrate-binding protein
MNLEKIFHTLYNFKTISEFKRGGNMALKKIHKVLIAAGAALIFMLIALILIMSIFSARTLSVAFYRVPENVMSALKSQIESNYNGKVSFIELEGSVGKVTELASSYNMVITWNGARADALSKNAKELPANLYNSMPTSLSRAGLRGEKYVYLPLLYDHEAAFYERTASKKNGLPIPETLSRLESNVESAADYSFPLFCAGKNNDHFFAFVSAVTESVVGGSGYKKLCAELAKSKDISSLMNMELSKDSAGVVVSFADALDLIRQWQNDGIIPAAWYNLPENDLISLMQYKYTYGTFMPLSYYRTLPMQIANGYESYRFPPFEARDDRALVAPAVVLFMNKTNKKYTQLAKILVSADIQEQLSNVTQLTPVSSRAGTFDILADDARFYAASAVAGPVTTLQEAAFISEDDIAVFAAQIREYLQLGQIGTVTEIKMNSNE